MRTGLQLAIVAWVGFAWVGSASGACSPEQIETLLYNAKISKQEMQRLCGRPAVIAPSPPPAPQPTPQSQYITWLIAIIALGAGGLAGALVTSRRQKRATTFARIEDYKKHYIDTGEYNKINKLLQQDPRNLSTDEIDRIRRIGN
jgi:hypothetical protein